MKLYAANKIDEGHPKLNDGSPAVLADIRQDGQSKPRGLFIMADSFGTRLMNPISTISQLAIEITHQEFAGFLEQGDVAEPVETYLKEKMQLAFEKAHLTLKNNAQNPEQNQVIVIMTAVCVYGAIAVIANVGHIRAYHLYNNNLHQITEDHTLYKSFKQKNPDEKINETMQTAYQNILLQALGQQEIEVDVLTEPLVPGDKLLLCNHNIWQELSEADLARLLFETNQPETTVQSIIDAAQTYYKELAAIVINVMA